MNVATTRFFKSGTLLVWGAVLSYFYFSGRVADYLHPAFHPGLLLSGVALLALGVAVFFTRGKEPCGCCHHHPELPVREAVSFLVLTIPMVAAALISPGGFGSVAVMNRGLIENISGLPSFSPPVEPPLPQQDGSIGGEVMMDPSPYLAKNEKGQILAETVDLLYAASEPTLRGDFENKAVEILGQFLPARTGNPHGDRFNLVQMFVMCCAADARPVAVAVQSRDAFPEMTWLKVTGKVTFPLVAGKHTALIVADSVQKTEPPAESIIY